MGYFDDIPEAPAVKRARVSAPEDLSAAERILASIPSSMVNNPVFDSLRGFVMGAADPVVGAAQLGAHVTGVGADGVDAAIKDEAAQLGNSTAAGIGRFVGNIASPTNLLMAAKVPMAATTLGRTAQGAALGAAGGALTPVEEGGFGSEKAKQIGFGALAGGVATPLIGKVVDRIGARTAQEFHQAFPPASQQITQEADDAVSKVVRDAGLDPSTFPPGYLDNIKKQIAASYANGEKLDAAALIRKADFDAQGLPALRGQVTRDPTLFAQEKNNRAIPIVGKKLLDTQNAQNNALGDAIKRLSGTSGSSQDADVALFNSLKGLDENMRKQVTAAYEMAKRSSGKNADVPLTGLAQDYANIIRDFGDKVPSGVRNNLDALGLLSGKQLKTFSVDDAERILKVINSNQSNDPAVNAALAQLRNSVKDAITAGGDDVFAAARAAAAKRFGLHDKVPALERAAMLDEAPDKFVNKYVLNGNPREVTRLGQVLKQTNPDLHQQIRAQVGERLRQGAFGNNAAGDGAIAPDRFAKALKDIGPERLHAFFSQEEIGELNRIARLGAYINTAPAGAPVLGNPNMVWAGPLMSILDRIKIGDMVRGVANSSQIKQSMNPAVPSTPLPMPSTLADLVNGGHRLGIGAAFGLGGASAQ